MCPDRIPRFPKPLLFSVVGMGSAFLGSATGSNLNPFHESFLLAFAWWDGMVGLFLGLGIAAAQAWHLDRLPQAARELCRAALISAGGGFVGGIALVMTIQVDLFTSYYTAYLLARALEGILIAMAVSRTVPNLRLSRAALAGLSAGILTGFLPSPLGLLTWSAFEDAFKGLFISLSIALAERLGSKA